MNVSLTTLLRQVLACSLASCTTFAASHVLAAPPADGATSVAQATAQVPGFYRHQLGHMQVTALFDGTIALPPTLLKGLEPARIEALIADHFLEHTPGVQTAVTAYLVHTGERLVLIDAGAAACFGPTLGQILGNLQAAGYAPSDVDTVLLTHLHPDHLCGLLGPDLKQAFPNATVWAAREDAEYWLNPETARQAPEAMQGMFAMAQQAVAPYQTSGRFKTFEQGGALLPGISVLPTHGHTPGHTSYLLESGDARLLVWGDIVHNHAVQLRHPEVSMEFDTNNEQAIATRRSIFERASAKRLAVAGAHMPFPGLGHLRATGDHYEWVPMPYAILPAAPQAQ